MAIAVNLCLLKQKWKKNMNCIGFSKFKNKQKKNSWECESDGKSNHFENKKWAIEEVLLHCTVIQCYEDIVCQNDEQIHWQCIEPIRTCILYSFIYTYIHICRQFGFKRWTRIRFGWISWACAVFSFNYTYIWQTTTTQREQE